MPDIDSIHTVAATLWRNEYDSLMRLCAEADGSLRGLYRSHTGASGDYRVLGFTARTAKDTEAFGVALSIRWGAIGSDDDGAGRHWVSGLSGQLLPTPQGPRLLLMHNLVVTAEEAFGPAPGFHLDKLHYDEHLDGAFEISDAPPGRAGSDAVANPLNGDWLAVEPRELRMRLAVNSQGEIEGTLSARDGDSARLVGLTDHEAESANLSLQSITISAASGTQAISFSGWLDRERDELVLLNQSSAGTVYGDRYLQTRTQGLRFRRS